MWSNSPTIFALFAVLSLWVCQHILPPFYPLLTCDKKKAHPTCTTSVFMFWCGGGGAWERGWDNTMFAFVHWYAYIPCTQYANMYRHKAVYLVNQFLVNGVVWRRGIHWTWSGSGLNSCLLLLLLLQVGSSHGQSAKRSEGMCTLLPISMKPHPPKSSYCMGYIAYKGVRG